MLILLGIIMFYHLPCVKDVFYCETDTDALRLKTNKNTILEYEGEKDKLKVEVEEKKRTKKKQYLKCFHFLLPREMTD